MKKTFKFMVFIVLSLALSSGILMLGGCGSSSSDTPVAATPDSGIGSNGSTNNNASAATPVYEGTVYMSSEGGGHIAVFNISIDPSNVQEPIVLSGAPATIQLSPGTGVALLGGTQSTHVFHDVRLDGDRVYYSSILSDPPQSTPVHLGYVDLIDNSVHDAIIDTDVANADQKTFVYSGSGQTATHYLPVTMLHPGYIDAIAKADIENVAGTPTAGSNGGSVSTTSDGSTTSNDGSSTTTATGSNLPLVGDLLGGSGTGTGLLGSLPIVGGLLGGSDAALLDGLPLIGGLLGGTDASLLGGLPLVGGLLGGTDASLLGGLPLVGGLLGGSGADGLLGGGLPIVSDLLGGSTDGLLGGLPIVGGLLGGSTTDGLLSGGLPVVSSLLGGTDSSASLLGGLPIISGLLGGDLNLLGGLPVLGSLLGGTSTGGSGSTSASPVKLLAASSSEPGMVTDFKRTYIDQFRGDSDYFFAHGASSPDGNVMLVTVNETAPGTGGQAANMTGTIKAYLLKMEDLIAGTVTQNSILKMGTVAGAVNATVALRSSFTPDGAKILQAAADRFIILDANTLQPLNGNSGDTGIGGSKKSNGIENHDAMPTSDSKYAILVISYIDQPNQAATTGIQLYDIANKKQIGEPVGVCGVCHAPTLTNASGQPIPRAGYGIDGKVAPK